MFLWPRIWSLWMFYVYKKRMCSVGVECSIKSKSAWLIALLMPSVLLLIFFPSYLQWKEWNLTLIEDLPLSLLSSVFVHIFWSLYCWVFLHIALLFFLPTWPLHHQEISLFSLVTVLILNSTLPHVKNALQLSVD